MQAHVEFTFTPSFLGNCHKLQPTKLSPAPLPALWTHTWDLTTGLAGRSPSQELWSVQKTMTVNLVTGFSANVIPFY